MTDREIMQQALTVLKAWDAVAWRTLDTIEGLEAALAQPEQDISYTDIQMAELIMSDCGHSSDYTPLLNRIAGRLATYRQALAQPEQEEPLPLVDIGVDVTPEGTHVVACYNRPDAVQEMFYSQFHPLAKPEQSKYSDIVSDGGLDPRNKFDAQPEPVQVRPHEFIAMASKQANMIGKPVVWAEYPTPHKIILDEGWEWGHEARAKEALAQPEQKSISTNDHLCAMLRQVHDVLACTALPMKRKWVGLTDEEIKGILDCGRGGLVDIKKAEQILKEKNGG